MKISDDLLKKYNLPVPRYTSYPPANQFKDTFSESNYLQLVKDSNNENLKALHYIFIFLSVKRSAIIADAMPVQKERAS